MTAPSPSHRFRGIRAVVFDFDGTLFDASDAIVHSFNAALEQHGRLALPRERIESMIGRPLVEMFPMVDPDATPERVASYVAAYREAFWPISVSHSRPLPGLRDCLEQLAARGIRMAIATNRSERGAQVILEGHGLRAHFAAIVAVEHVLRVKPHPDAVRLALEQTDVPAAQALMVGDTPDDVAAGRAAGTGTVGVITGYHDARALAACGADLILDSLVDLPGAID